MAITYYAEAVKMPRFKKRNMTAWIKAVAAQYGKRVGEVSYLFCDDEKILEANREYLQHDYYTDIITFDESYEDEINGDILISLDTVLTNAEKFEVSFENELHRIIIHGILHLCGQDDVTTELRQEMIAKENQALELLTQFVK